MIVASTGEVVLQCLAIFDVLEDAFAAWGWSCSVLAELLDAIKRTKGTTQFDVGVVVIPIWPKVLTFSFLFTWFERIVSVVCANVANILIFTKVTQRDGSDNSPELSVLKFRAIVEEKHRRDAQNGQDQELAAHVL